MVHSQAEAKRLVVEKVVTQARVEGVPLSDAERKMPDFPRAFAASAVTALEASQEPAGCAENTDERESESMAHVLDKEVVSLPGLTVKTVVVHTVTYFVAGALAYTLGDYETTFSQPPLSYLMRPTSDPWVLRGPLLQPVRGVIFALALYPLRNVLFARRGGWLTLWWLLVALGVLSTFGPAPGSVEGLIYTIIPPMSQILGLWEVLLQSLLLSVLLFHWINHPGKRWLNWTLGLAFSIVMILPMLALIVADPEVR
jgi:hypothetical protein